MKHVSFPLFVLLGYFAVILMAATSVVADAAKLVATLPTAAAAEAASLPAGTEVADLGSMTVTARTGHGAHAYGVR